MAKLPPVDPSRYWADLVRQGVEFYVAGRCAAAGALWTAAALEFHFAVELLLKACLLHDNPSLPQGDLQFKYSHGLAAAWADMRAHHPTLAQAHFDQTIDDLGPQWDLRYPDQIIRTGMMFNGDWPAGARPGPAQVMNEATGQMEDIKPHYFFSVGDVDNLVAELVIVSGFNVQVIKDSARMWTAEARAGLAKWNTSPTATWV